MIQTVIVTGAGRGVGLAICQHLLSSGYNVVGITRTITPELKDVQQNNEALDIRQFDLANIDEIHDLCKDVIRATQVNAKPTIYGLINNAAVGNDGVLSTMHSTDIKQLIDINVHAPILLTKYFGRAMMLAGNTGRVVNIGSIIGKTGYSGLSVYGATKAAMEGFSRSLSRELGKRNITVNVIAPGYMETNMTAGLSDRLESIKRRSALGRFATTDDIAEMTIYLLSDAGKNITGTVLTIDGGSTA